MIQRGFYMTTFLRRLLGEIERTGESRRSVLPLSTPRLYFGSLGRVCARVRFTMISVNG